MGDSLLQLCFPKYRIESNGQNVTSVFVDILFFFATYARGSSS